MYELWKLILIFYLFRNVKRLLSVIYFNGESGLVGQGVVNGSESSRFKPH